MILMLDSDTDRLAAVSAGLAAEGKPVLGLDRAAAASRLVDAGQCELMVLSDLVAGWRRFLNRGDSPVLLLTDDPSRPEAEGAAASLGTGIGAASVLQMAHALLSGGGHYGSIPWNCPR